MNYLEIVRILFFAVISFVIAILWTPLLTHFLYKYKLGKKIRDKVSAPVFNKLHQKKEGTPTMGGLLIWVTVVALALFFALMAYLFPGGWWSEFNFLNRGETWLPLGLLVASALVGMIDDWFNVLGVGPKGGGLRMRHRLMLYGLIALVGALWFYFKLDWSTIHIPFVGGWEIGWWYIPCFMLVIIATGFSVNETDGLDGLVGGVLLFAFGALGTVAFIQGRFDLAVLCGAIVGALTAFLWFNIFPARFFMGDTGAMSLGVTLGVIAMFTSTELFLPIIGIVLVLESLSVLIQLASKKLRHKKIFLSSPIHHHLEAKGWPEPKIVMRLWVISGMAAVIGLILVLADKTF